ncbi:hypothetical protein F5X68DRAFT_263288 [Plectosphaerella plurivora]|uniref:Zn(2)-C6 fungal-type domain-containing protein n=1 Tax=Plectosphaerella plurivora TaxID=936078 RepID=A0A9P8V7X7_9PEZI|nr:hypothetical protein F5X68DRAFT_263288 [Plectosphaerella plurivora]
MIETVDDAADKTRQKSCNACVRSKRRCDKRTPRCARCADKGVTCVYPNLPNDPVGTSRHAQRQQYQAQHQQQHQQQPQAQAQRQLPQHHLTAADLDMAAAAADIFGPPSTSSASMPASCEDATPSSCSSSAASFAEPSADVGGLDFGSAADLDSMVLDPMMNLDELGQPGFGFDNFMNYMSVDGGMQPSEMRLWRTSTPPLHAPEEKPTAPRAPSPVPVLDHRLNEEDYQSMVEGACVGFQPWQIHDRSSRMGSIVRAMKSFPLDFARTRQTPFLHRELYRGRDAPREILTLFTATTAYANRNPSNEDWAIRIVFESVDELLRTAAADAHPPHAPQTLALASMVGGLAAHSPQGAQRAFDKLARVHALFLYQVIRAFDGDISMRAQAERDMPILEAWVEDLEGYRDNLAELWLMDAESARTHPPRNWDAWVLHESMRRTIFVVHGFISMYGMLKWSGTTHPDNDPSTSASALPDPGRFARAHRWTAGRALWEADSPVAFFTAWREKPRWFVENIFIKDVAREGAPEDIDDFTKIWMTAFMGVDQMTRFMAQEGAAGPAH